jgi:anti-sigma factor RsiW
MEHRRRAIDMTCDEAKILLDAFLDGELDAGHSREVEAHVASCPRCSAQLRGDRALREALSAPELRFAAPVGLRRRINAALPEKYAPSRRTLLRGFAMGTALSGIAATGAAVIVFRADEEQRILDEVVTAHLRSLQMAHLIDVESSDQHTVKPWFSGKLDVAPPVVDLTAQGFKLLGGRLDYVNGRTVASIVYQRRAHVINLFVAPTASSERSAKIETVHGFNIRYWSEEGLNFWAVSDIGVDELREFGTKFDVALRTNSGA